MWWEPNDVGLLFCLVQVPGPAFVKQLLQIPHYTLLIYLTSLYLEPSKIINSTPMTEPISSSSNINIVETQTTICTPIVLS